jgi:hypothetical protein
MSINQDIFVVGNSWSIPSMEAPRPAFDMLGLKNREEHMGISLDAQAEYILSNDLVNKFKVIWLIGHHHRADPLGNGDYLLPYNWGEGDIWGSLTRDLWFKKMTRMGWYERTNALFIKAVLGEANVNNLLMIPIYRPNMVDHPLVADSPCIWRYYLRDLTKRFPDGRGHMSQAGHQILAPLLAAEVYERWKITLTLNG